MRMRRLAAAVGGLIALGLAACDEAGYQVVETFNVEGSEQFLRAAAAKGPVWVDLRGNPFGDTGGTLDGVVTEAFRRGMSRLGGVSFTTDRDLAGDPRQRLVLVFGGARPGRSVDRVCEGDIPTRAAGLGPNGEVRTLTVFCNDTQIRAAIGGIARGVTGPDDENLFDMLVLTLREMFRGRRAFLLGENPPLVLEPSGPAPDQAPERMPS